VGAVIVTILIFMTAGALKKRFGGVPALRSSARYLHILIGVQLLLGVGAYWSRLYAAHFPQPVAVMVVLTVVHTVTGALVLAVTLVTALISYRMIREGNPIVESTAASQQVAQ
jgi:cytochrome b561